MANAKDAAPRWAKDAANTVTRRWAMASARTRGVPDYLIIGTKRGGTTSLHRYLLMHPGVLGLYPEVRGVKSTDYFFKHTHLGETWYRSHFHTTRARARVESRLGYAPICGEASPYYLWDPRVAERVRALAPEVRAIVLLRDPVERAWSHYHERRGNGVEPLGFIDALDAEDTRIEGELERMAADPTYYSAAHDFYTYRERGVYLPQLRNWLQHFDRSQLLVLSSEQMYADVQATMSTVAAFLGLPDFTLPTTAPFNASAASAMPAEARERLRQFYAPHNAELESYLGMDLGWPS